MSDSSDTDRYGIRARLAATGRKQTQLARYLNMDPSVLLRTIKGVRALKAHELLAINQFFEDDSRGEIATYTPANKDSTVIKKIPIFGYALARNGGRVAFNDGQIVEWIDPPPYNVNSGEFFGIRVVDDSMQPRYFSGEYAIAQRALPPVKDRDCLVEFRDGSAVLKTYRYERDGFVFCGQWNPNAEVRFKSSDVKAIHAIVWRR